MGQVNIKGNWPRHEGTEPYKCATPWCDVMIEPVEGQLGAPRRYHNDECRREYNRAKERYRLAKKRSTQPRTCKLASCDNRFTPEGRGNPLFCSPECKRAARLLRNRDKDAARRTRTARESAIRAARKTREDQLSYVRILKRESFVGLSAPSLTDLALGEIRRLRNAGLVCVCDRDHFTEPLETSWKCCGLAIPRWKLAAYARSKRR